MQTRWVGILYKYNGILDLWIIVLLFSKYRYISVHLMRALRRFNLIRRFNKFRWINLLQGEDPSHASSIRSSVVHPDELNWIDEINWIVKLNMIVKAVSWRTRTCYIYIYIMYNVYTLYNKGKLLISLRRFNFHVSVPHDTASTIQFDSTIQFNSTIRFGLETWCEDGAAWRGSSPGKNNKWTESSNCIE